MRLILIFLVSGAVVLFQPTGTVYYVSADGGTGNGLSPATAWSWTYFQTRTLGRGDEVRFRRGDVFYGTLNVQTGVTYSGNGFGSGAPAKITGLVSLTNWTNEGSGIYSAPLTYNVSGSSVRIVVIDGLFRPQGRWPNLGANVYVPVYNTIDSITAKVHLRSLSLVGKQNWAGAEVAIRGSRWTMDRKTILTHNPATGDISFADGGDSPRPGSGFFIQNHLATLDKLFEWYHNPVNNKLYVYFGAKAPAFYSVKASGLQYLINASAKNNVTIRGLDFEGANDFNVWFKSSSTNVKLVSCNITNAGMVGAKFNSSINNSVDSSFFTDVLNRAIEFDGNCAFSSARNNTLRRIGLYQGQGQSGAGNYTAVYAYGTDVVLEKNVIDSVGLSGVRFEGNNFLLQYNYLANCNWFFDDTGPIYTRGNTSKRANRVINNNIVISRALYSNEGYFTGTRLIENIYLDDNTSNVIVSNNFSVGSPRGGGIMLHDAQNITVTGNICYNNSEGGLKLLDEPGRTKMTAIVVKNNYFIAKAADRAVSYVVDNFSDLKGWDIDSNRYMRPATADGSLLLRRTRAVESSSVAMSLDTWKAFSGKDAASTGRFSGISSNDDDQFYDINFTDAEVKRTAPYPFKDHTGAIRYRNYTLAPWSGIVGFKLTTSQN